MRLRKLKMMGATVVLFAGVQVTGALPASAAPACATSSPSGGAYSVDLCIDAPAADAVLSGNVPASATATITGTSPGVMWYAFYLDGDYLLIDYRAPIGFEIPTEKFVDGTHLLEVEARMRDGFISPRTGVSVTFGNGIVTPPVNTNTFTPSPGRQPGPGEPFVVAFTGDGGDGSADTSAVASHLVARDPNLFAFVGDVYEKGSPTEFHNYYDGGGTLFGALKAITNPIVGNHEYDTGSAFGYFDYWDNIPSHYSYDANGWHFIALNSTSQANQTHPGSDQFTWLQADLAANPSACTVAYFHHPVLSVGPQGDTSRMNDIWQLLVDNGVDMVVSGHDHSYQRWNPLDRDLAADPGGVTQFVTGGGGHGIQSFVRSDSRLAAGVDTMPAGYGALELELNTDGARFDYRNTDDQSLDSGTIQCGGTSTDTLAPTAPAGVTAVSTVGTEVEITWNASTDNVGVDAYTVYRDGVEVTSASGSQLSFIDLSVSPDTGYSYTVDAVDGSGNHSTQSVAVNVMTAPPPSSFTFTPEADAYVHELVPDGNYGTQTQLRTDGSPLIRSFVKFDVTGLGGPITSAILRVNALSPENTGYEIHQVTDNTWTESAITHNNAPTIGPALAVSGPVTPNTYTEIDITPYITGNGTYTLALTPRTNTNLRLGSRETPTPPQLVIQTGPGL